MEEIKHKPFAITARAEGLPKLLFTRLLVANMDGGLSATYVNALWDTGAEFCVMSAELALKLGCNFSSEITMKGISQKASSTPIGFAYISLVSNGDLIETITAIADGKLGDNYSFIIGMNFIRRGSLAISFNKYEATLSFTIPDVQPHIDFTKITDRETYAEITLSKGKENLEVYKGADALALICPDR